MSKLPRDFCCALGHDSPFRVIFFRSLASIDVTSVGLECPGMHSLPDETILRPLGHCRLKTPQAHRIPEGMQEHTQTLRIWIWMDRQQALVAVRMVWMPWDVMDVQWWVLQDGQCLVDRKLVSGIAGPGPSHSSASLPDLYRVLWQQGLGVKNDTSKSLPRKCI